MFLIRVHVSSLERWYLRPTSRLISSGVCRRCWLASVGGLCTAVAHPTGLRARSRPQMRPYPSLPTSVLYIVAWYGCFFGSRGWLPQGLSSHTSLPGRISRGLCSASLGLGLGARLGRPCWPTGGPALRLIAAGAAKLAAAEGPPREHDWEGAPAVRGRRGSAPASVWATPPLPMSAFRAAAILLSGSCCVWLPC